MRVATVSEMLGGRHKQGASRRDYPAEGSLARRVYDRLLADKGRPVRLDGYGATSGRMNAIRDLTDFYGCDIRRPRRGVYILAGEWFGAHYSDYVNQAINEAIAKERA